MTTLADINARYPDHIAALEQGYGAAIAAAGWDGIVIHSGAPQLRTRFDDAYWPLRPTPYFQHWLPLAEADCALLVRPGARPVLYRPSLTSFWEGRAAPESDRFWSAFEVVDVATSDRIRELLPAGKLAFIGEDDARAAAWGFSADAIAPAPLLAALDQLRTRKTAYERGCLAEANRRAAIGHRRLLEAFHAGDSSELELHLLFLSVTGQDDHETPYKNIVALGEHAATLHHIHYGRTPRPDAQSLLVDAGATCLGYASDVTRTSVKGDGAATDSFGALIAGLEGLQQEVCARVVAGLPYESLHNQSHELLAPVLRDVGIAHGSDGELVEAGITRAFFPHGLGHSLGLVTHDVGCALIKPEPRNPFLRNTSKIETGQVFTIEPGCYFIDSLLEPVRASAAAGLVDWKLVGELRRFGGVRIEDDLWVGQDAVHNLTREQTALA